MMGHLQDWMPESKTLCLLITSLNRAMCVALIAVSLASPPLFFVSLPSTSVLADTSSTLVNATSIVGIARDFRGRMLVKLKTRVETLLVSDSYTHLFRQM